MGRYGSLQNAPQGGFRGTVVGEAQRIEQVWDGDEEGFYAVIDGEIGDCGGQVSLSAAVFAAQHQPTVVALGELFGLVVSILQRFGLVLAQSNPAARLEVLKGQVFEFIKLAVGKQLVVIARTDLGSAADTNF